MNTTSTYPITLQCIIVLHSPLYWGLFMVVYFCDLIIRLSTPEINKNKLY